MERVGRLRAYRRRRWRKAYAEPWTWRDAVTAVLGAAALWVIARPADVASNIGYPLAGAMIGLVLWHYAIRPIAAYVRSVPEDEHLGLRNDIDERDGIIHKLDADIRNSESARAVSTRTSVVALAAIHKEGVGIRDRIRKASMKWDNNLKVEAKHWEAKVVSALQEHAPHFVGRFQSDVGRTRHPNTFDVLGHHSLNWGDLMDCRLGNLQDVIEQIVGAVTDLRTGTPNRNRP